MKYNHHLLFKFYKLMERKELSAFSDFKIFYTLLNVLEPSKTKILSLL